MTKRVLVIDDNSQNRKLEKDLLEVAGYQVMMAEDAEQGIAMAKQELPDFIVMDYQLPGMDGIAAVEILGQDEKTKDIPFAFVTAAATKEDIARLKQVRCATVISKPIDTRNFVKQLEGGFDVCP